MTAPAIIKATFSDYRRVRGRKVGQLVFEVPLELLHDAITGLGGEPSVENDTWVAIARLEQGQASPALVEKWKPEPPDVVKECVLTCKKETFWDFVERQLNAEDCDHLRTCDGAIDAATYVRNYCGVNTRGALATDPVALRKWKSLDWEYQVWLEEAA